jgi:hypothetical protein
VSGPDPCRPDFGSVAANGNAWSLALRVRRHPSVWALVRNLPAAFERAAFHPPVVPARTVPNLQDGPEESGIGSFPGARTAPRGGRWTGQGGRAEHDAPCGKGTQQTSDDPAASLAATSPRAPQDEPGRTHKPSAALAGQTPRGRTTRYASERGRRHCQGGNRGFKSRHPRWLTRRFDGVRVP